MAKQTNPNIRQQLIYQVFPRNHSNLGNFQGIIDDLPRIKSMGVDIIYLLPIHPIGEVNRKGDLGSPYAIKDYYAINEEYGSMVDFKELLVKTHEAGMRLMIDIVINHTSPDHSFTQTHPEYYYRKVDGTLGNKVGDWTDIVDLDYNCQDLWAEMTRMLVYWTKIGIDGFRCDVASFVPVEFWIQARDAVNAVNPNVIWLAESVHKEFLRYYRNQGYLAHSDGEVYQAFDICYDYDIQPERMDFMQGNTGIEDYSDMLTLQDSIYPANYAKLRFLENHDQPRIHSITQDKKLTRHWISFSFFQKGTAFLYAGQEAWATHRPSLFTKDLIGWENVDQELQSYIASLSVIKKQSLTINHKRYDVKPISSSVMQVMYENDKELLLGYFVLAKTMDDESIVDVDIPDGTYENQLTHTNVIVDQGKMVIVCDPIVLAVKKHCIGAQ